MQHLEFVTIALQLARYDFALTQRKQLASPPGVSTEKSQADVIALGISCLHTKGAARAAGTIIHRGNLSNNRQANIGYVQFMNTFSPHPIAGLMIEQIFNSRQAQF